MSYYFNSIIEITLPITAFICLMLLLSPLIKKVFVTKWRYFVWLFAGIRLLLPFPVQLFKPISISVPQKFTAATELKISAAASNLGRDVHVSIGSVLFYFWIIGVFLLLCMNIFFYIRFKKNVNRHKRIPSQKIQGLAEYSGISKDKVIICNISASPMVFGILKPVIILPHENYSDIEINMILKHESVHYKNKDVLYKLILLLVLCIHWFNPFVYMMHKAAMQDLELSCDYEVVEGRNEDFCAEYCHTLVSAIRKSKNMPVPCSTNFEFSKKLIGERIASIFDKTYKRKGRVLLTGACVFVLICGGIIEYTSARVIENTAVEDIVSEFKISKKSSMPLHTPTPSQISPKTPAPTKTPFQMKESKPPQIHTPSPDTVAYEEESAPSLVVEDSKSSQSTDSPQSTQPPQASPPTSTHTTPETQSSYSIEEASLNITVVPDMDGYVLPIEFTGNEKSVLSVGCINGECGYRIIDTKTGEVAADNLSEKNKKASIKFDSESSYYIQVFNDSEDTASIYVYKE